MLRSPMCPPTTQSPTPKCLSGVLKYFESLDIFAVSVLTQSACFRIDETIFTRNVVTVNAGVLDQAKTLQSSLKQYHNNPELFMQGKTFYSLLLMFTV